MNLEVKNNPRVSIILPTFNGSAYIKNAIQSVLLQTYDNFELLVAIDGSVDDTENLLNNIKKQDKRIVIIKNDKNIGLVGTLNKCLSMSKGVYIARIDDDDEWIDPEKLEKQVDFLDSHNDYGLIGTDFLIFNPYKGQEKLINLPSEDTNIRKEILSRNPFCHSSVLFRKQIKKISFNYNLKLKYTEDWDLWLRIGCYSKLKNLTGVYVRYKISEGMSKKNNKLSQIRYHLRIILYYYFKYPNGFLGLLKLINYAIFY